MEDFWIVYIIEASDHSLYTGITKNLLSRWEDHHDPWGRGAKFFRGRIPLQVVYWETQSNRSEASKREAAIKKMTRKQKVRLIDESLSL